MKVGLRHVRVAPIQENKICLLLWYIWKYNVKYCYNKSSQHVDLIIVIQTWFKWYQAFSVCTSTWKEKHIFLEKSLYISRQLYIVILFRYKNSNLLVNVLFNTLCWSCSGSESILPLLQIYIFLVVLVHGRYKYISWWT